MREMIKKFIESYSKLSEKADKLLTIKKQYSLYNMQGYQFIEMYCTENGFTGRYVLRGVYGGQDEYETLEISFEELERDYEEVELEIIQKKEEFDNLQIEKIRRELLEKEKKQQQKDFSEYERLKTKLGIK